MTWWKRRKKPKKPKKIPKYSKIIVFLVVALNFWFARKVLNVFLVVGNEPTSLIIAWFGFTTGELWLLSQIKKKEIDKEVELKIDNEGVVEE